MFTILLAPGVNPIAVNKYTVSYHIISSFYSEELLARHPTSKLEDHQFSTVRYCLFNIFAADLHIRTHMALLGDRKKHTGF